MYSRANPSETVLPLEPIARSQGGHVRARGEYQDDFKERKYDSDDDDGDEHESLEDLEQAIGAQVPAWKSSAHNNPTAADSLRRHASFPRRLASRLRQRWFTAILAILAFLVFANLIFGDGSNVGRAVVTYVKKVNEKYGWSGSNMLTGSGEETAWAKAPWVEEFSRPDLHYDTPFNRDDLTLTQGECDAFFPKLWKDLERARDYYSQGGNRFDREALERSCDDNEFSQLRVVVYHNRLYVKMYKQSDQSRTQSTLSLLQQSITSSRERLPDVEFCLDLQDWGHRGMFSLSRSPTQQDVWLMPDYAFFAWPQHIGGSYKEFREKSAELEKKIGWEGKINKLFWRGSIHVGTEDRQALLDASDGHEWNDVQPLDWGGDRHEWVSMIDHCKWKFHGFPEGNTYSGRLRYLQHCRSVIVTHEPHWIQHWTHLYNADPKSPDQNIVFVPKTKVRPKPSSDPLNPNPYEGAWTRLPEVMDDLLRNDTKARQIADNQWTFFRERYVSPASAACYWRRALQLFASIQAYDVELTGREVSFEDHMINGFPAWPPPPPPPAPLSQPQ